MCRDCNVRKNERRDFRQGGVDESDFEEEVRYRKPAVKASYSGKRKRPCKKSKTGEVCDFIIPLVTWQYFSKYDELWHYTVVQTCSRCGKHGPYAFGVASSRRL